MLIADAIGVDNNAQLTDTRESGVPRSHAPSAPVGLSANLYGRLIRANGGSGLAVPNAKQCKGIGSSHFDGEQLK
jgi:hypothetical protein